MRGTLVLPMKAVLAGQGHAALRGPHAVVHSGCSLPDGCSLLAVAACIGECQCNA